ncbi:MAG: chorismate synthase [Alphaproteobacteria bacterium]|nr:chorismate synthase [Alphaproteobacteria bacterium]
MSHNSFGRLLRLTTFGESHGTAIGGVLDGMPAGIILDINEVQKELDRRKPGQSKFTTQRRETDKVEILSGVLWPNDNHSKAETTGTSIGFIIWNIDQKSQDYSDIAEKFRPGHADLAYLMKYGVRDHRGGGRASARETAIRVAAGAMARQALDATCRRYGTEPVEVRAGVVAVAGDAWNADRDGWPDWEQVYHNPLYAPFATTTDIYQRWEATIDEARRAGDSCGAAVRCFALNVWPGLGAPVYAKLDADLAAAMMSINAVKAIEIGEGVHAGNLRGSDNADQMTMRGDTLIHATNHAGGVLGGISTGAPIDVKVTFKPTSSILTSTDSIARATLEDAASRSDDDSRLDVETYSIAHIVSRSFDGIPSQGMPIDPITAQKLGTSEFYPTTVETKGRHDPCVGLRAVPVVEAMMCLVLLDHLLMHIGSSGGTPPQSSAL